MACHNNRSVVPSYTYVVSTEYQHDPQKSKIKAT